MGTVPKLKITTHSTFSSRSFAAYMGYIPSMLSTFINWSVTPKVTITDWRENSNLQLSIKKLPNNDMFLVYLENDCYNELYSNTEELTFAVVTFIETNLLPKEKLKCQ